MEQLTNSKLVKSVEPQSPGGTGKYVAKPSVKPTGRRAGQTPLNVLFTSAAKIKYKCYRHWAALCNPIESKLTSCMKWIKEKKQQQDRTRTGRAKQEKQERGGLFMEPLTLCDAAQYDTIRYDTIRYEILF